MSLLTIESSVENYSLTSLRWKTKDKQTTAYNTLNSIDNCGVGYLYNINSFYEYFINKGLKGFDKEKEIFKEVVLTAHYPILSMTLAICPADLSYLDDFKTMFSELFSGRDVYYTGLLFNSNSDNYQIHITIQLVHVPDPGDFCSECGELDCCDCNYDEEGEDD